MGLRLPCPALLRSLGVAMILTLPAQDAASAAFEFGRAGDAPGFMLWNEPWEGLSISTWSADVLHCCEPCRRMSQVVQRACKDVGVDVLAGGCDSSTIAWDKLSPEGRNEFLPHPRPWSRPWAAPFQAEQPGLPSQLGGALGQRVGVCV